MGFFGQSNPLAFLTQNDAISLWGNYRADSGSWSGATASGGLSGVSRGTYQIFTSTSANSRSHGFFGLAYLCNLPAINFDKRMIFSIHWYSATDRANLKKFFQIGRTMAPGSASQLDKKGFGIERSTSGITPFVHNGTSITSGSTYAIGSYARFILDFRPSIALDLYASTRSQTPTLLGSVNTGLPSGNGNSGDDTVEISAWDTGSGGANNWDYVSQANVYIEP